MKHIKKSNLNSNLYVLDEQVISIRSSIKFQEVIK